ncbi:translation initiation factor eIF-1A [Candidatus Micrarchaeota archaeon]|nr:translation initiation factor eIF-1A [Candidatus Micrarchaeota archaeon]
MPYYPARKHGGQKEFRLRSPRPGEIFGIVREMKGGARMIVECMDGKDRLCRIPGKIKSRVWVKEGDLVLIVPWTVESDEKADIVYRYTALQAQQLRNQGILKVD